MCCAAALATLELVENEYLANVNRVGPYLLDAMRGLMQKYAVIGEVRGKGLWIGVEFVEDRQGRKPAHAFTERLLHTAFHNGLLLLSCGSSTIRLMPPLMVGLETAREAVAILDASIAETIAAG